MKTPVEIVNTTTVLPLTTSDVYVVLGHPGMVTIYILLSFFSLFLLICVFGVILFISQRVHRVSVKRKRSKRLIEATRKALKKLVLRTLSATDKEVVSGSEQCAVCIELYRALDVVRILPCRHMFHKKCIDPWLLERRSCPLCKLDILISCGIAMDISSAISSDYSSSDSSISVLHFRLSHRPTWIGRFLAALLGYARVSNGHTYMYQRTRSRVRFPISNNHRLCIPGDTVDRGFCDDKQPPNFQPPFNQESLGFFSDWFPCCCCLLKVTPRMSLLQHLRSGVVRPAQSSDRLCEYHASILGVSAMPPTVQLAYYDCYSSHANAVDERHTPSPSGLSVESSSPHRGFVPWQLLSRIKQCIKEKCVRLQQGSTAVQETAPSQPLSPSGKRQFVKPTNSRIAAEQHREKVLVHTIGDEDSFPVEPSMQTMGHLDVAPLFSDSRNYSFTNVYEASSVLYNECKSIPTNVNSESLGDEISECSLMVLPPPTDGGTYVGASSQLHSGTEVNLVEVSESFPIGCSDKPLVINRSQKLSQFDRKPVLIENVHSTYAKHSSCNAQCYNSIYPYGLPEHAPPPPYYLVVTNRNMSVDVGQNSVSESQYSTVASYSQCCPMCRAARMKTSGPHRETLLYQSRTYAVPENNGRSKRFLRSPSLLPHAQSLEVFTRLNGPQSLDSIPTDEAERRSKTVSHSLMHGVRVIVEPPEVQYHRGSSALESNTGSTDDWETASHRTCANSEPTTITKHIPCDHYARLAATV